jgi:sulfur-carrier protein
VTPAPKTMRIKIYTVLELKKILGQREMEVSVPEGMTVKGLLSWMIDQWGEKVTPYVYQTGGDSLLPQIRLMINGRAIEFLSGMNTVLKDGDEFLILPLLTGG